MVEGVYFSCGPPLVSREKQAFIDAMGFGEWNEIDVPDATVDNLERFKLISDDQVVVLFTVSAKCPFEHR